MAIKTQAEFSAMLSAGKLPLLHARVSDRIATLYDYVDGKAPSNPLILGCLKSFTDQSESSIIGENTCCEEEWVKKYKYEMAIACPTPELLGLWHRSVDVISNPVSTTNLVTTLDVPSSALITAGRGRLSVVANVDMSTATVALVAPATPLPLVLNTHYTLSEGVITLLPHAAVIAAAGLVNAITITAPQRRQIEFKKNTAAISNKVLVIEYTVGQGAAIYRDVFHNINLSSLKADESILDEAALTPKFSFVANKDYNGNFISIQIS